MILITGGCGFLGSNIAQYMITAGEDVTIFDNLSRQGGSSNLNWIQQFGDVTIVKGDIRANEEVSSCIQKYKPDVIYHLAGQVAMTTSIQNPRYDFEVNALGTLNVLEAVRKHTPHSCVLYSSTNKVYGDLNELEYTETPSRYFAEGYPHGFAVQDLCLDFHSPYGCSKGAADQYMLDYSRIYGLNTIVFRHSSMYGGQQYSTSDQGWIGWFCEKAIERKKGILDSFTISGTGKQVRDILHANDIVKLYSKIINHTSELTSRVYNVGGGMENSLSLLELFALLELKLDVKLNYEHLPWRKSDQKVFVADIRPLEKAFGWKPKISYEEGIDKMIEWVNSLENCIDE